MQSEPRVLKEYSREPSRATKRPHFNRDFSLDFVEDFTECRGRQGTMNTALPNTLGADLYLFVETPTLNPLHFELMLGEAFSIKYYAPYIERVEAATREAVVSQQAIAKFSHRAFLERVPVRKSACARILVVGGEVCFLYFPSEPVAVMRGLRFDLAESDDCQIACCLDENEIVCFDGWIRIEIRPSDQVLIAQPEENAR